MLCKACTLNNILQLIEIEDIVKCLIFGFSQADFFVAGFSFMG